MILITRFHLWVQEIAKKIFGMGTGTMGVSLLVSFIIMYQIIIGKLIYSRLLVIIMNTSFIARMIFLVGEKNFKIDMWDLQQ